MRTAKSLLSALINDNNSSDDSTVSRLHALKNWNNDFENPDSVNKENNDVKLVSSGDGEIIGEESDLTSVVVIDDATNALHSRIISTILSFPPHTFIRSSTNSNEELGWNAVTAIERNEVEVFKTIETDEEAHQISMEVANVISLNTSKDDSEALSRNSSTLARQPTPIEKSEENALELLAELLRTCKNMIRWNRYDATATLMKQQQGSSNSSSWSVPRRLQSLGMIKLYLVLLDANSRSDDESISATSSFFTGNARDDVARNASLSLFHSTFSQPKQAEATEGLSALVKSFDWISTLMKNLLRPNPVPLILSLVRHVHNLVGTIPNISNQMDSALDLLLRNKPCLGGEDDNGGLHCNRNIITVLVSTLGWTIRSEPEFPGEDGLDRRSDLAIEILRVLFALQCGHGAKSFKGLEESNYEAMTQLGIILIDILHLSNKDLRAYQCKLAAVMLLMESPPEYSRFLFANNAIGPLITVLELQLDNALLTSNSNEKANALLPILVTLNRLSTVNTEVMKCVKMAVFPPEAEEEFKKNAKKAMGEKKNMQPIDAPKGTLRWKIIRLMTSIESNVKRCGSELLWTLCGGDSTEFVLRTGFGNAVHMLSIKGLVKIPQQSSVKMR